jgi:hypothetical protein
VSSLVLCLRSICLYFHLRGLTAIGGFLPFTSIPPSGQRGIQKDGVTMTFSGDGFFGLSLCMPASTQPEDQYLMWWSTYAVDPPPEKNSLPADVYQELLKKHGHWKSPYDGESETEKLYPRLSALACDAEEAARPSDAHLDTIRAKMLVLPRYKTERLLHWTSYTAARSEQHEKHPGAGFSRLAGRIILLGDAAHPVPPDSGQGVASAVEDALCLALLLKHYVQDYPSSESKAGQLELIHKVAQAYEEIRIGRIASILRLGKGAANNKRKQGVIEEKIREVVAKLASKLVFLRQNLAAYRYFFHSS